MRRLSESEQELVASAVELLGSAGATSFAVSPPDSDHALWTAVATFPAGHHEAASSDDPVRAVLQLVGRLVDAGDLPTGR